MRKLFWGCTAASVAFVGGVWCAAHYSTKHRESLLGRFLTGANQVAGTIQPPSSLRGAVVVTEDNGLGGALVGADGLPADPTPEPGDEHAPTVDPAIEAPAAPPAIVIPEQEPAAPGALIGGAIGAAAGGCTGAASSPDGPCEHQIVPPCSPTAMPYCGEEEAEPLRMPTLCEEGEESEDGCCADDCTWWGLWSGFKKMFEAQPEASAAPMAPGCPSSHYHHTPVCPYTGRCQPPTCDPPAKADEKPGAEEPSEPGLSRLLRKAHRYRSLQEIEDTPVHPEVDTMDFRPCDRSLTDYGPGPL
jgi:hypothetical protein